jgi:hypothetical protein
MEVKLHSLTLALTGSDKLRKLPLVPLGRSPETVSTRKVEKSMPLLEMELLSKIPYPVALLTKLRTCQLSIMTIQAPYNECSYCNYHLRSSHRRRHDDIVDCEEIIIARMG